MTFVPLFPFNAKPWVPPPLQPPKPGSPEAIAAEAAAKAEEERLAAAALAAAEEAAKAAAEAPPPDLKRKLGRHLARLNSFVRPSEGAAAPPRPRTKEELAEEEREQAYLNVMDHLCKVIPPTPDWAGKHMPRPGVLSVRILRADDLMATRKYPERPEPFVSLFVFEGRRRLDRTARKTQPSCGLSPTWNEARSDEATALLPRVPCHRLTGKHTRPS